MRPWPGRIPAPPLGIGIALGWHGAGFTGSGEAHLASVATVELTTDGAILALVALTEMGQGARTVLGQLVAEALDVPAEAVDVVRPDTSRVPNTGPTVASRTTMIGGGLLATAAAHLRHDVEAVTGRPFAELIPRVRPQPRRPVGVRAVPRLPRHHLGRGDTPR